MFTWSQASCLYYPNTTNTEIFFLCMGSSYIAQHILIRKGSKQSCDMGHIQLWLSSPKCNCPLKSFIMANSTAMKTILQNVVHKIIHHLTTLTVPLYCLSIQPLTRWFHTLCFFSIHSYNLLSAQFLSRHVETNHITTKINNKWVW